MTIVGIDAIPVAYPEPNDFGVTRRLVLARVQDSDGAVGWGEAVTTWEEATIVTAALVERLAPLVVGRDAVDVEAIWDSLRRHTTWYGRGGLASLALSAIDMAIWDLKGKLLDQPLIALLGGAVHDRLPAIASAHAVKSDLDEMADEVGEWLAAGYHGYKFGLGTKGDADLGRSHDRDVAFVAAVRERIGDKPIMVDAIWGYGIRWDVSTAIKRIRAFEEQGVFWIEEPLEPVNDAGYLRLKTATNILLAYGEREFTVEGYDRLLRTGAVDVVGVDPGRVEGITSSRKIIERIEAAHVHFNAHSWSSALNTAASLALSASTPSTLFFELKPLPSPMQHELVADPIEHAGGWIAPLEKPGLGVEVVEAAVEQYRLRA
jgi:L-alanine-DL-glutamate epimerase-like enolase superfamily enzyme